MGDMVPSLAFKVHELAMLCLNNNENLKNCSPEYLTQKYIEYTDKIYSEYNKPREY